MTTGQLERTIDTGAVEIESQVRGRWAVVLDDVLRDGVGGGSKSQDVEDLRCHCE